ncbi:MAG TPA: sensor domain-containing protein [Mycobacterium sp.]|nr:sensor domain-containing protein [Mycobacterium sp.]
MPRHRTMPRRQPRAVTQVVCLLVLACCLVLAGCSNVVAGTPKAGKRGGGSNGPIFPSQLVELLTPSEELSAVPGSPLFEQDMQNALFTSADPAECHGVAGYGGHHLFPNDYTGREARTQADALKNQHQLLEVSATYPSGFNAAAFLDSIRKLVSGCQHPITAWSDDQRKSTVDPTPLQAGSPEVVQWSTKLEGEQWFCDFAMIAKANVVAQIVTCSPDHSVDIKTLIAKRLKKIEELINSTA